MNFCRSATTSIYTSSIQLMKCMYECITITCKKISYPLKWIFGGIKKICTIFINPLYYLDLDVSAILNGTYILPKKVKHPYFIISSYLISKLIQSYLIYYLFDSARIINNDWITCLSLMSIIQMIYILLMTDGTMITILFTGIKHNTSLPEIMYENVVITYNGIVCAIVCTIIKYYKF